MKIPSHHWIKSGFRLVLACLFIVFSPLAEADEQTVLQESAKRVECLFEEGKITEQQALTELGRIEAMAIAYRKKQHVATPSVEDFAGTTLMRRAVFPNFSVFGFLLRYVLPSLALTAAIGFAVFFYGSSFGLNRAADWFGRRGRQASQLVRDHTPGHRARVPETPPIPRTTPHTPDNRPGFPPHPPFGSRHSGEVPDHLA